jgi:rhamnose transport system ATP-binding protein
MGRARAPSSPRPPESGEFPAIHVAVEAISKRFGGAQALESVSVSIARGEVHGLVGENGAGKSTLGRIIAGVIAPDEGAVIIDGERLGYFSPRHALRRGITMIAQELVLLPAHTVLENVFLGVEATRGGLIRRGAQLARFRELNARTGFGLDPNARVESLRVAERQLVEIMRALARDARLIVMDEPTAALTRDEAAKLLTIIRTLREHGRTVIFVSHRLEDVLSVADTVTVLRNGRVVRTAPATEETSASLVRAMLGMELDLAFPARTERPVDAPVALSVSKLCFPGGGPVSLDIRAGEIVGIAGLVGSGRSELARAIFGAASGVSGSVLVEGRRLTRRSPRTAIRAGMFFVPEDRRDQGLLMGRSVQENLTVASLQQLCVGSIVRRRAERDAADGLIRGLDIRPAARATPVSLLSGGNQQKVMLARACFCEPRVLIVDEPTRGVDVGAKRAIHELLMKMAEDGLAILLISSEFEEVIGLAHRILVMRAGRIIGEFPANTGEETLMTAAVMGERPEEIERAPEILTPSRQR